MIAGNRCTQVYLTPLQTHSARHLHRTSSCEHLVANTLWCSCFSWHSSIWELATPKAGRNPRPWNTSLRLQTWMFFLLRGFPNPILVGIMSGWIHWIRWMFSTLGWDHGHFMNPVFPWVAHAHQWSGAAAARRSGFAARSRPNRVAVASRGCVFCLASRCLHLWFTRFILGFSDLLGRFSWFWAGFCWFYGYRSCSAEALAGWQWCWQPKVFRWRPMSLGWFISPWHVGSTSRWEKDCTKKICTEDASRLFLTFADYILNRASWSWADYWWHICCQVQFSRPLMPLVVHALQHTWNVRHHDLERCCFRSLMFSLRIGVSLAPRACLYAVRLCSTGACLVAIHLDEHDHRTISHHRSRAAVHPNHGANHCSREPGEFEWDEALGVYPSGPSWIVTACALIQFGDIKLDTDLYDAKIMMSFFLFRNMSNLFNNLNTHL